MSEEEPDKLISVRSKSGKSSSVKYHTEKECRFLDEAANVRPPQTGELGWHDAEECSNYIRISEKEQ
jgi:hypothetical protein